MSEVWKDINGYKELYQVSNWGRVKSLKFGKERILKPGINGKGYFQVQLWKNNNSKNYVVHRLVAQAFIPNPDNLPCINHRDECKTNNNVENLEWCSYQYNINYGTCIQRKTEKQSKTVYQYSMDGEFVKEWKSLMEIERSMEFSAGSISQCCNGKLNTAYGYVWRYKK